MARQDERRGLVRSAGAIVGCLLWPMVKIEVVHGESNLPTGPAILAVNHVTELDPVVVGYYVWRRRRWPHFLAKSTLFTGVFGKLLTALGQVPVSRNREGSKALGAASSLIHEGHAVIFYPEGTLTRDLDLWPMRGKSGAVRLALETGAPIIPIAQWGVQDLLGRYESKLRPFPRKTVRISIGEPVALAHTGRPASDSNDLSVETDAVMVAITAELERIRGQKPTDHLFDPARDHGFVKPKKHPKHPKQKRAVASKSEPASDQTDRTPPEAGSSREDRA